MNDRGGSLVRSVWVLFFAGAGAAGCETDNNLNVGTSERGVEQWRNDQGGVVMFDGSWGSWRQEAYCNHGSWAVGYEMRVESSQGGGLSGNNDDTALNSVRLFCRNPTTSATEWISSYDGLFGSWRGSASCASGHYLVGGRMRMEGSQGGDDDTAANSFTGVCSNALDLQAPGGMSWGSWGSYRFCPINTAVCGLEAKFESSQGGGDDTALNGIELQCCNLPGCSAVANDGVCSAPCENYRTSRADCGWCGDGYCLANESAANCQADCHFCGDGICYLPTEPGNCPSDCGSSGYCGDGYCESSEQGWCQDCYSQPPGCDPISSGAGTQRPECPVQPI